MNEHTFWKQRNWFVKKFVVQNCKWIVQRKKKLSFFKNEWKKNERSNGFIKRLFSNTINEIDGKWMIILRTNEINFLMIEKKNAMGPSRTIKERNGKSWTCLSLPKHLKYIVKLFLWFYRLFLYFLLEHMSSAIRTA